MIDVPSEFRPHINTNYPSDTTLIFEEWFYANYAEETDRGYLPIFWTSFYVNNNYGKDESAKERLQQYINTLDKSKKYFTICQYDDGILNDISGLDILVFHMSKNGGYEIPLLCQPHDFKFNEHRDIFANFIGSDTHPIRKAIFGTNNKDYYVSSSPHSLENYCKILSKAVFTLCPRGYGATSFRIGEALQFGSIPVYVSDKFITPHKELIDFEEYGVLIPAKDADNVDSLLRGLGEGEVKKKQAILKEVYEKYYTYEANKKIITEQVKNYAPTMMISLEQFLEKRNLKPKGVIHVGAHFAEEHDTYISCGIKKVIYIEPCKEAFKVLQKRFKGNADVTLFNCACGDFTGLQEMNTSKQNEGQSNSLLKPKLHLQQHPEIKFADTELVEVRRLDDLDFNREDYDLLMMDTQGFEGLVLKGALQALEKMNLVYSEVNKAPVYEDCVLINELDEILEEFTRAETCWAGGTDWGDAIYVRDPNKKKKEAQKRGPNMQGATNNLAVAIYNDFVTNNRYQRNGAIEFGEVERHLAGCSDDYSYSINGGCILVTHKESGVSAQTEYINIV